MVTSMSLAKTVFKVWSISIHISLLKYTPTTENDVQSNRDAQKMLLLKTKTKKSQNTPTTQSYFSEATPPTQVLWPIHLTTYACILPF